MQICERGFYQLVVNNQLLIRTRDKRAVEYYYREAHRHYSSSKRAIELETLYTHTSSSNNNSQDPAVSMVDSNGQKYLNYASRHDQQELFFILYIVV